MHRPFRSQKLGFVHYPVSACADSRVRRLSDPASALTFSGG